MVKEFKVTGMSCAACSAKIEKDVGKLEGMNSVNVNLLRNSMTADYDESKLSPADITSTVEKAGYGAYTDGKKSYTKTSDTDIKKSNSVKKRLIVSLVFLVMLMFLSMGHMFGMPLLRVFDDPKNALVFAFTQFLLTLPVIFVNSAYYKRGFGSLMHGAPNMDTLIALGSAAAEIYGIAAIYIIGSSLGHGNIPLASSYMKNLYFESAAMILTLITVGKYLESRAKGKTSSALEQLMALTAKTAHVIRGGEEVTIDAAELVRGDIVVVRAGEKIAADGVITEGSGTVDESMLTGESLPADKTTGDSVTGATINRSGCFRFSVTHTGEDSTIAGIIRLVETASSSKAPAARLADKVSGVFVPVVTILAVITFIIWAAAGKGFDFALSAAISVLVISCPCALGLATPTAIMVGTGSGARLGILIKSASALEELSRIDTVVFDKTGTLTEGKMTVTDVIPADGFDKNGLAEMASAAEKLSEHPISGAICEYHKASSEATDIVQIPGRGISAEYKGKKILAGNILFMSENGIAADEHRELLANGKTVIYFAYDGRFAGCIALFDKVRRSGIEAVREMKRMGITVMLLSGDNKLTAEAAGREAGVDSAVGGVLPGDKGNVITKLRGEGKKVMMVGDGINDAVALTAADVGTAVGTAADIAVESADVVTINRDLMTIAAALKLGKAVMKNIKENLFWAFFYNIICIPLAAGALYPAFGIKLNPMIGAAAMSLSSVFVVTNALRLRRFGKEKRTEEKKMTKTIRIKGMMCSHCTGRVSAALNAIDGVKADVTLDDGGKAIVECGNVSDDVLKKAVTDAGYEAVSIE